MKIINLSQVGKTSFVGKHKYVKKTQNQPEQKNNGKKLLAIGAVSSAVFAVAGLAIAGKFKKAEEVTQEVAETVKKTLVSNLKFSNGVAMKEGKLFTGLAEEITEEGGTLTKEFMQGKLIREILPDGTEKLWPYMYDGKMCIETLSDGTERKFIKGKLTGLTLPNGEKTTWSDTSGMLRSKKLPDGTEIEWYENGIPESMLLPDGTRKTWYSTGLLTSDIQPDGSGKTWYNNGQLESEILPDGSKTFWPMSGNINCLKTKEIWEQKRKPENIHLADGTIMHWDKNGCLIKLESSNGTIKRWNSKNGELIEIKADIMLDGDVKPTSVHLIDNEDGTISLTYGDIGNSLLSSDEAKEKIASGFSVARAREILGNLGLGKYITKLCL